MNPPVPYPIIDTEATGQNIRGLREDRGLSVAEVQAYLGLGSPQAIYHWQQGRCLPSVDHLYALSALFDVTMNEIIVPVSPRRSADALSPKSKSLRYRLAVLLTQMNAA